MSRQQRRVLLLRKWKKIASKSSLRSGEGGENGTILHCSRNSGTVAMVIIWHEPGGRADRAGHEEAACKDRRKTQKGIKELSKVRVLVGTRKGAFVLESDGKRKQWDVSGPHFAGWEIYHIKGSPADPNRLYASQSSGWFGQLIQRSNDGGQTWQPVGNRCVYD